jgi:undecaprenyl-diphosphatase
MHTLLRLIQRMDISVYYWLSRLHGSWFFDRLTSQLESNTLFKSGLFISMYWYFWFREERDEQERRNTILTILVGTLAGLFITRMVATFAPFRVRPLYDLNLQHQPLSIPIPSGFVDWSSFPSDHAAFLSALGFGLIRLSRRLTIPIVLYLTVWICLPRMYLGIHYASDVFVGAGIGVASVWAALKIEGIRSSVARPLLAFMQAKPQVFYTAAFLISFEMATMFWDIREPVRAVLHATLTHHIALGLGWCCSVPLVVIDCRSTLLTSLRFCYSLDANKWTGRK